MKDSVLCVQCMSTKGNTANFPKLYCVLRTRNMGVVLSSTKSLAKQEQSFLFQQHNTLPH